MIKLTGQPIDIPALLSHLDDSGCGGVVLFLGKVRDHSQGEKVVALEYEAYEKMAMRQLQLIETEVRRRWPVRQMAIVHRTGYMKVGEVSLVIVVACPHRAQAFEACRYTIDTLKQSVPIWKKEYRPDGSSWVDGYQARPLDVHDTNPERQEEVTT